MTPLEAKIKAYAMVPLIAKDLREAARLYGIFEAGERQGAGCSGLKQDVHGAIKLNILLCLARIFEFGTSRGYVQDKRDIASLPFLIRLMAETEVQEMVYAAAALWSDASLANENMAFAEQSLIEADEALQAFEGDPQTSRILDTLHQTRNSFIAHRLLQEANILQQLSIADVRFLLDAAMQIFTPLQLALFGEEDGFFEQNSNCFAAAKALWQADF